MVLVRRINFQILGVKGLTMLFILKLEDTTNFEERREIRQQLRELRKKKLDALESATTTANERPRRRERVKREEQSTVVTETKTTDGDSKLEPSTIQTKIEVNYSHTVITDGPSENGIENGHVESENVVVEEETVSAKEENLVEEQPVEGESGTQFSVQINGEKSSQDKEEEEVVSAPQSELSTETETVQESSETLTDDKPPEDNEEETEEVELTPEVVEKMEDVDQLEKLVRMEYFLPCCSSLYIHARLHKFELIIIDFKSSSIHQL